MKKYESYKDSGVQWIGEVPSHWDVAPLKRICTKDKYPIKTGPFGSQLKGQDLLDEGDVIVYNQRNVIDNDFSVGHAFVTTEKAKALESFTTRPLDLLITSRGTIGKCAILEEDKPMGILHPCLIALRVDPNICIPRYALLFINESQCFKTNVFLNSNATTIEVIYTDTLKSIAIPLPPVSEQSAIVKYLEDNLERINHLLDAQNHRIELLNEIKQSLITKAVTNGIHSDVFKKDTGIEWISQIPSHWNIMPLKQTTPNTPDTFMDGDWIESKNISEDGIRYLTSGNVGKGEYKEQGDGFITEETFKELDCLEVFPGDVLISRLNLPSGRSCIIPDLGYRIVTCVDNVIYRPFENLVDKEFMVYQMNCAPYAEFASNKARGATMQRITRNQLGAFKVLVPPLEEQKEIVSYLKEKLKPIEQSISKAQRQIEILTEYKQSLITEVVTGKRKVC